MTKKKNIIIAAVAVSLLTGFNAVQANTSNNLLQMDVKRSSAANTVDVTFYTTGDTTNSVVTRKSNNRYVVLLPNVAGSSSVAPGIGGVKDLITDIDVKNVNDGIGGYTKVTFGTTKPINIKTYIKKTAPLSQAQKDYKALIAQNNSKPAAHTSPAKDVKKSDPVKPAVNKQQAVSKQPTPAASKQQTAQKPTKPQTTTKAASKSETPAVKKQQQPKIALTPVIPPGAKNEPIKPKAQAPKVEAPKVQIKPKAEAPKAPTVTANSDSDYIPRMKFDENGKRTIDLEPRITHEIVKEQPLKAPSVNSIFTNSEQVEISQTENLAPKTTAVETPNTENKKEFPMWILIAGGTVLFLGALFLVFDAVSHSSEKDRNRFKSFFNISPDKQTKRRKSDYQDIIEDESLNWQEKYKKYTEKDKQLNPVSESSDMSYVTDMSATKKAIIAPKNTEVVKDTPKQLSMLNFKQVTDSIKNIPDDKQGLREKLQAKISQMEHSLAQTPSLEPPEEVSLDVRSEDDAISGRFSEIKLKSFAKPVSLKQANRFILEDEKKLSRNKSFKEGRFVKLKNSPLSVSHRKSASSQLEVSDLMNTANKYLTNNGEMKMDKQNENYLLSSLDEYLSILDSEDTKTATVAQALSHVRPSEAMSRSGITNPISRASNPMAPKTSAQYMNGLIVKSGYNIDSEKGFYIVNLDGVSALVGRIKDDIFILKKFDYVVDKQLQVRQDHGSVYIVKAGGFKCLVDVAKDKMGTLIEI